MPRCNHCKTKFEPKTFLQKHCLENDECVSAFIVYKDEKIKQNNAKKLKSEKKVLKEKLKGIPELKKDLERYVNKICCLIDKGSGCISCGGHTTPQCGHYHTVNSNGSLRYNLHNLHLQDYNCNCAKGGNIHHYDLGLIKRYGKQYWEYVKFDMVLEFPLLKMAINDFKEKIPIAISIVKELQEKDVAYNEKERIELRNKYNEKLGIYL